jgi:para-nitrobenzyl esterase
MVFVHGGGFTFGAGSFSLYDGANFANATGAIIVTMNYRLGPFGFLSNAALRTEDPAHPSAGNYALEDQIASFQWVKTNIAAFGGDPARVTIFGESAGGTSMLDHLASPKSAGLFAHMIIESGWCPEGAAAQPQTMGDQSGANLATALGCTDPASLLTCMRGKSASDVLNAMPSGYVAWFPVVDGFILPKEPLAAVTAGAINKVPTILGNNANEPPYWRMGSSCAPRVAWRAASCKPASRPTATSSDTPSSSSSRTSAPSTRPSSSSSSTIRTAS